MGVYLYDLMKMIGEEGYHIFVRYDPLRKDCNFSVVLDGLRLGDTDSPATLLGDWWEGET